MQGKQVHKFDKMEVLKKRNKLFMVRYKIAIGGEMYLQTLYMYQDTLCNAVKQLQSIANANESFEIVLIEELAVVQF